MPEAVKTILVVDDQPPIRRVLQIALEVANYHVLLAESGAAALELAVGYEGTIDLLLTDVVMPEMDGPELADRFRAHRPGTRVLFISADSIFDSSGASPGPAPSPLLPKPFTSKELRETVRRLLGG